MSVCVNVCVCVCMCVSGGGYLIILMLQRKGLFAFNTGSEKSGKGKERKAHNSKFVFLMQREQDHVLRETDTGKHENGMLNLLSTFLKVCKKKFILSYTLFLFSPVCRNTHVH